MNYNMQRGRDGEDRAAAFLEQKGFSVLERNYRFQRAEIDLIVRKANWLVFVEVKTRSSVTFGYPEEAVDARKVEKILTVAEQYLAETGWQGCVRYDIVSVTLMSGNPEIRHFEDAFY